MALTDMGIKALAPKKARFTVSDERGLCLEVFPTGGKLWHYRYRLAGRAERVTLGKYPDLSLKLARNKRDELATQVALGKSPAKEKRSQRLGFSAAITVKGFSEVYFNEHVAGRVKNTTIIRRYLDKDINPYIGTKTVGDVTAEDIRTIVFRKRDAGFEAAAGQLRGLLNRIFEYAVVQEKAKFNPVAALPLRYVAKPKSRTRALTGNEIRVYIQGLYKSNIRRQFKLALHLILLTMVRKSELLLATWDEVDFEQAEWNIPAEHVKTGVPHTVYLSAEAVGLLQELKQLSAESTLVLPSRGNPNRPFAHNALNHALKGINFDMEKFTIHDMRRTASTLLHEAGFESDVVEKALNHTRGGVRGVYNRAEYGAQRKDMLQFWATYVNGLASEKKVILGNFRKAA